MKATKAQNAMSLKKNMHTNKGKRKSCTAYTDANAGNIIAESNQPPKNQVDCD